MSPGSYDEALSLPEVALPPEIAENWRRAGPADTKAKLELYRRNSTPAARVRNSRHPHPILKGVALAQLAYGSFKTNTPEISIFWSPRTALKPALSILQGGGYALSPPAEHLSDMAAPQSVRYGQRNSNSFIRLEQ